MTDQKQPFIAFNRPSLAGRELDNIQDAVRRGQLAGDGYFTAQCQGFLEQTFFPRSKCLLTHSCTAALEMAALLCDLGPGDEVVMPSYTFVSTANAVALRGATPVFVDIRRDTLNIDEQQIESAITSRTRAICVVHYAGVACEMDTIMAIARRHRLRLVEDAAQALGSRYKGRPVGTDGDLAAFSFHETKNIISGEGGAIVINDPELVARGEIIREKGTNRRAFFEGLTDKYTWVDLGSSLLPGELIAAFLYAQLVEHETINRRRKQIWRRYRDALLASPHADRFILPTVPNECESNGHLFHLILEDAPTRARFIAAMRERDIMTPFHYVPLHNSPAGMIHCRADGALPNTEELSARLVRLPLFHRLSDEDVDRVLVATDDFFRESP